jgi:hypothetical protein
MRQTSKRPTKTIPRRSGTVKNKADEPKSLIFRRIDGKPYQKPLPDCPICKGTGDASMSMITKLQPC